MAHQVLLIASGTANRILMRVKLAAANMDVLMADSLADARLVLMEANPVVVLADPASLGEPEAEFCRTLRHETELGDRGLVILQSEGSQVSRPALFAAGADEVLSHPVEDLALMPVLRAMIRRYEESRQLVGTIQQFGMVPDAPGSFKAAALAVGSDDRGIIEILSTDIVRARQLKAMLAGHVRDMVSADKIDNGLPQSGRPVPDILLLDLGLLDIGTASATFAAYRNAFAGRATALLVVTAHDDAAMQALARDMGAADAFAFGSSAVELAARLRIQLARKRKSDRQRHQIDETLRLAAYDDLTGLMNRRAGLIAISGAVDDCRRRGKPLSLLLLDVNSFKAINDLMGHAAGDAVLQELAARIPSALRDGDLLCRLGGDEFLIALPEAPAAVARLVSRRIERAMSGDLPTLAIGSATAEPDDPININALIAAADQSMYRTKAQMMSHGAGRSVA